MLARVLQQKGDQKGTNQGDHVTRKNRQMSIKVAQK